MVSIVISALNHLHDLTIPCIHAIRRNTMYPYELIGVDDGSTDGTFTHFQRAADKAYRHTKNKGLAAGRNTGIRHATGKYIYFLDNDIFVHSGWLTAHMREHGKNPTAIVGDIPSDERRKADYEPAADGLIYVDQLGGGAMCVPRYVFGKIGGFDTRLPRAQDTDFCFRARLAGIKIALTPKVILHHLGHRTMTLESRKEGILPFQRKWAGKLSQFSWR